MIKIEINGDKADIDFGECNEEELKNLFIAVGDGIVQLTKSFTKDKSEILQYSGLFIGIIKQSMYSQLRKEGIIDDDTMTLDEIL